MNSQPAAAKESPKGKFTQTGAEGYCNEKGGTFWVTPDGANYGCGYKGGGGLMCDKDTGCLESDGQLDPGQEGLDRRAGWVGLFGLAGLAGLAGLGGRKRDSDPAR